MTDKLILPTIDKDGIPYISSTQLDKFSEKKSFTYKVEGVLEYILQYFLKEKFDDVGWAEFGHDVEEAIVSRDYSKFTNDEIKTLQKVEAYELHQYEVKINFDNFYFKGYIDTISEDLSKLKDFKTGSEKSKEKYSQEDYKQILYYGIGVKEITGIYPELSVEIIERKGNAFTGGRSALSVGNNIWVVEKHLTKDDEDKFKNEIKTKAYEISEYYKVFIKLNN